MIAGIFIGLAIGIVIAVAAVVYVVSVLSGIGPKF